MDAYEKFASDFKNEGDLDEEFEEAGLDFSEEEENHFCEEENHFSRLSNIRLTN